MDLFIIIIVVVLRFVFNCKEKRLYNCKIFVNLVCLWINFYEILENLLDLRYLVCKVNRKE